MGRYTLHSEGSLRRPLTPVPPTSCTLSGLGPGWARFQNVNFNHFLFCLLESCFLKAQLSQLLALSMLPFSGCCVRRRWQGERRTQSVGHPSRDLRPTAVGRPPPQPPLGNRVPIVPQRHLLALGSDNFEVGGIRVVMAPAAADPGWASHPCDLLCNTDS